MNRVLRLLSAASCMLIVLGQAGCARGARPGEADFTTLRPPGEWAGEWVGGINVLGGWETLELALTPDSAGWAAVVRVPTRDVSPMPARSVRVSPDSVAIEFRSPYGVHTLRGSRKGGLLVGSLSGDGLDGRFHLVPIANVSPGGLDAYAGSYRGANGAEILVTRRHGGTLAWAEMMALEDGSMNLNGGSLYPLDDTTFISDRSIRVNPDDYELARFKGDRIEWVPESRPAFTAERVDGVRQERVRFRNGDVELGGTLFIPPGTEPRAAMVWVHGSGPRPRTDLGMMLRANLFLRSGVAVLMYDKRGAGESEGDWQDATFTHLAGDARAALELLRRRTDINPGRIGLGGHSQAGWIIPLAVSDDIAFVAISSGGAVPPSEQELYRAGAQARADGLSPDQVERARRLMEVKWTYARTGEGWDDYLAAARGAAGTPVFGLVGAILDRNSPEWSFLRHAAAYDPAEDMRRVRQPFLLVLGGDDANVPATRAADAWRKAMIEIGNRDFTLVVVPDVGHGLISVRDGMGSVFPASYIEAVSEWIRRLESGGSSK